MANTEYHCVDCDITEILPLWRYNQRKKPFRCRTCARKESAKQYKLIKETDPDKWNNITNSKREAALRKHSLSTPEQKSEHAKKMRSAVRISGSEMRQRQQAFIDNADPEYYSQYCEKRRHISQNFHDSLTPEQKEIHYRKVFKNNGRSKACDDCLDIIESNNITIIREVFINGLFVDGLIKDTNIILEFYGDMFHCNPIKFQNPEQYCSWISRTVQEQWDRDRFRLAKLYQQGYKIIVIWENGWKLDRQKYIKRIQDEMCKC